MQKNKIESCGRCGRKSNREAMYHIQLGFGVVWMCSSAGSCGERQKLMRRKKVEKVVRISRTIPLPKKYLK